MAALPFLNVGRRHVETDPSGRYKRYDTIIGEGAMKKVYLGLDGDEGKEVAWSKTELTKEILKDKKLLESLCTEAKLMKVLRHDNIVTCFKSWIDYEHKFINMITEYLPSGNLGDYVRRYNPVIRIVIRNWCKQILKGLDYLHRNHIIHRDLNTDNIFIDGSLSTAKIGDLGLALMFQHGANKKKFSCRPEFMAPELYDDDEGYSQLIDIYAFGMSVLQMVTRETPYSECVNKYHIRGKVKAGVMPKALSHVQDEGIKDFIMKCLSSASARPNASDLLRDSFFGSNDSGNEAGSSIQSKSESEDTKQKGTAKILESNDSNTVAGSRSQSKSESKDTKQKGATEIPESNDPNTEVGRSSQSKRESEDTKKKGAAETLELNDSNTGEGSSSQSKSESEDTKKKGAAETLELNDFNTGEGSSSQSKSESEDTKKKGAAETLELNDFNTGEGSSSQSKSESEDTKQKGAAETLELNDSNTGEGSSSQSKSESEDTKQKGAAEIPESNDSNTDAGSSSQIRSESEDQKKKGPAEILPLNDPNTEAGGSSKSKSESENKKQKGPAEILPSNDSNTEAGSSSLSTSVPGFLKDSFNEMVGEQPLSLRVRVQPRSFRLRGKRLDDGTFKIRLYFNNTGYEFDYSPGIIVKTIFEEDPDLSQLLSEMTITEFVLMSALLNDMVTSEEPEHVRIKFLEITSEGREIRPVFQPNSTPKPPVPDTMQQH